MPRTPSLCVCLLAVVLSVAGLVVGLFAAQQRKAKLCYQGKPLEYWFNQLGDQEIMRSPSGAVRTWGSWIETPETSANAIRGIGTNALGFYLRKLRRDVGTREIRIAKAARAVGFNDFWIRGVDSERGQAVTALILLKPLPPQVVSELVALSTNKNQDIAAAAQCALRAKEKELLFLHPAESNHSIDADLFRIQISADFP